MFTFDGRHRSVLSTSEHRTAARVRRQFDSVVNGGAESHFGKVKMPHADPNNSYFYLSAEPSAPSMRRLHRPVLSSARDGGDQPSKENFNNFSVLQGNGDEL